MKRVWEKAPPVTGRGDALLLEEGGQNEPGVRDGHRYREEEDSAEARG